ncbi:uncharacterized protein EV420DRAFT_1765859 [Desarmillaria tabescens]|uniref:Uncharacterized protein n=1 Tax=Armillaria tabescens TaxID=1929756 RepID=A0AA39N124_ARMTA|nr:uncharacterized protein EV420DRAFT_1765859 [Desarmillaria tabescens]KAK0454037.1 hypothetical protein EV420DRAFT_1765859 [Desarmillaria tabescens]
MAIQIDIPSDITDDDKAYLFQTIDAMLNAHLFYALLHGIYTGVLAVTLWNISINKCWQIRRALAIVIIILYALITINFAVCLSKICSAFIDHGENFWTVYSKLTGGAQTVFWETGITASLSTLLVESYMIWCCWMVWGRRRLIVLLPIFFLISAIVSRTMQTYYENVHASARNDLFTKFYLSFNLATTLSCNLLIIYRITTIARSRRGAEGRLRVYRRFIQVLVESSAVYAISQLLYLAFSIRNNSGTFYSDIISAIAKGVAPTLLVGRAAAGHTQPKDDSDETTVSALHFRTPSKLGTTNLQESTMQGSVLEMDVEAQSQRSDEFVVVVERIQ